MLISDIRRRVSKVRWWEVSDCQTAVDGMMLLLLFCLPLVLLSGLAGRPWDRVTGPGLLAPDIRPGTSLV